MFDELKIRYKELVLWKRLVICAFIGLLPAVDDYFTHASDVEAALEAAVEQEKTAAEKLLAAERQLQNMAKTQGELEFTRDQLKKAESRLPDEVMIDEVLRTIGKVSKEMSVNIRLFEPQAEVLKGDEYKYSELPLKISIEGREYSQICEWLDRIVGGKSKLYLKSWKLARRDSKRMFNQMDFTRNFSEKLDPLKVAEEEGRQARDRLRLVLDAEVSAYKLATPEQIAAAAAKEAKPATPGAPAPPGVKPPPGVPVTPPKPTAQLPDHRDDLIQIQAKSDIGKTEEEGRL